MHRYQSGVKIKEATGLFLLLLNLFKFDAWASVWKTIYIRKEHYHNERLIAHEMCHIGQIKADGWYWQPIKYLYYTVRYGYKNNPYEVEARKAEDKVL